MRNVPSTNAAMQQHAGVLLMYSQGVPAGNSPKQPHLAGTAQLDHLAHPLQYLLRASAVCGGGGVSSCSTAAAQITTATLS
jgi:hypothetical protein